MNTGMDFQRLKKVYGLEDFSDELEKALQQNGVTPQQMMRAFYDVYAIHEVGHYYFDSLSNSRAPDRWINEVIATYFSFQFFTEKNPSALPVFELFHRIDRDLYKPRYTSIKDLNEIYDNMGVQNYLWYHSNFYFLVKSLYDCKTNSFIPMYEKIFPPETRRKLVKMKLSGALIDSVTEQ